jgi:hypothetical protein
MKLVLGDGVEAVKIYLVPIVHVGVEAGITLTHYRKNSLRKELPGLLLEPLNKNSLHFFVQHESTNGFLLNNPHSLYFNLFYFDLL